LKKKVVVAALIFDLVRTSTHFLKSFPKPLLSSAAVIFSKLLWAPEFLLLQTEN